MRRCRVARAQAQTCNNRETGPGDRERDRPLNAERRNGVSESRIPSPGPATEDLISIGARVEKLLIPSSERSEGDRLGSHCQDGVVLRSTRETIRLPTTGASGSTFFIIFPCDPRDTSGAYRAHGLGVDLKCDV